MLSACSCSAVHAGDSHGAFRGGKNRWLRGTEIYSQIIMPMCKPGLATLVVFTFNFMWNDYMGPMIYLNTDKLKTIQIGLAAFRTEYGAEYGLIMAGTVCSLLPMVLIYCVAQKYLIEGIAFSGLKG
ncbi:MAG: carbohydrate ABC transporter permease [Eisenbergiella sp.]